MFNRRVLKHLSYISHQLEKLMISSQDVLDKVNAASTKEDALIALAESQKANLAEVRSELQTALSSGDQTALQAAVDKLQEMEDHADATITNLNPAPNPGS